MNRHDDELLQIPLFAGFTKHDLEHIHAVATSLNIKKGDVLMEEGTIGHEMFVIISGAVEVTHRGQHVADILAGGFAGELALLCNRPRNSKVVAKVDSTVLHIDGRGFMALLDDVPHLAVKMLPIIAARVNPALEN
ncbi:MAG: cyclic nucleotide-binding domain-containing protein [Actinomycetota bacterium]|nr:cyclic nucleotide-binding domain-containing protein [Actinomycetota bacterium]